MTWRSPERSAVAGENPFLKSLVQIALRLAWDDPGNPRKPATGGLLTLPGDSPLIRR